MTNLLYSYNQEKSAFKTTFPNPTVVMVYARFGGRAYFLSDLLVGPSATGLRTLIEWGVPNK